MSATLTKPQRPAPERSRMNRAQAAAVIKGILTETPQSEAAIRRIVMGGNAKGGTTDVIRNALGVLEAQHEALRIPNTAGSKLGGWIRYTVEEDRQKVAARPDQAPIEFPYAWEKLGVDAMFIDPDYQRPLTQFVDRIQQRFDPVLFQTLAVSDRGATHTPKRFAVIDGQTRWVAAHRLGIKIVPCIVFHGLTPQNEADIFARLQKERRGIMSWHRFRAALAAGKQEAHAIKNLALAAGYTLGENEGELRAVAALEAAFRIDPFLLERTLSDFKEAWPTTVPESSHIRGLHYFFRHYPIGDAKKHKDVDDERLVRRLAVAGPEGLKSKAIYAKSSSLDGKGSAEKWMGHAIQNVYSAR